MRAKIGRERSVKRQGYRVFLGRRDRMDRGRVSRGADVGEDGGMEADNVTSEFFGPA